MKYEADINIHALSLASSEIGYRWRHKGQIEYNDQSLT